MPTINEIYEEWLPVYSTTVKQSTLHKTETLFRLHILPYFGDYIIDKMQTKHIDPWIAKYSKTHVNFKSYHNYLRDLINFAKPRYNLSDNPCDYTRFPTQGVKKVKKVEAIWVKNQLKEFLEYIKNNESKKWYAFFRLLAYSGMRRGEILALEWSDLDFKNKTLSISKSRKRVGTKNLKDYKGSAKSIEVTGNTKTGDDRVITLDVETMKILQEWKVEQSKFYGINKIMFTNSKNDYIIDSTPLKILNRSIKDLNLPKINIHRFRHIHTTMIILANKNRNSLPAIMDRLGHSDITTTINIYNHIMGEEKVDIVTNYIEYLG